MECAGVDKCSNQLASDEMIPLTHLKAMLYRLILKRKIQALAIIFLGVCWMLIAATSVESNVIRVVIGMINGMALCCLLLSDRTDPVLAKLGMLGFAIFAIAGYTLFTVFSATADFASWLVLVALVIGMALLSLRS